MLRPKLWSAAARRRCGLFLPGRICESSCLAAKRFPVRLTAARWAKARAGSIAREPYASPKTLECGGSAPLWPVSPWTHLRIKLSCCEAISRPVDRGKVGQSASGLDRTRTVCFAYNFGVRRPVSVFACFSLVSFANQAVLLRSDFPSGDRGVRWAKARAGSIAREPYASPKTLECGGPAPLWPVSPWTHLRIKLSCCEAISRPVDRGVRWAKARAGSIAREPYASPKTLECGGPAPLWPVSPWTHLRIKLSYCEAIFRPVDRGKVGQSASGL